MELKYFGFIILIIATISVRARRLPYQPAYPIKSSCLSALATPYPAVIDVIEYFDCCQNPYNDQLILPPLAAELPRGLGYFPAALPLIGKYYEPAIDYLTTGAYLPVTSGCGCLTLAAPVSPEIAPLVKPIIL